MSRLTVKEIRAAKPGTWLSDGGARGAGALLLRIGATGTISLYFRYKAPNQERITLPIGRFDETGRDGLTLSEARIKAGELSKLYQSGVRDIRGHLEAQDAALQAEKAAQVAAQAEAEQQAVARQHYTLKALCESYIEHLERRGKRSARDVRSVCKVHVFDNQPEIAKRQASEITPTDVALIIRKVREAGKERTAGVLRSYLRAAYALAVRAPVDSEAPSELIPFNIQMNPVDAVPAIAIEAGERTLTPAELKTYHSKLGDSLIDQALKLALLAGGQRMSQLLRATVGDWDSQSQTLRLLDGKGNRRKPREHLLPLGPTGAELVEGLVERATAIAEGKGEPTNSYSLWASTDGVVVVDSSPGKKVVKLAAEMKVSPFNLRDIRRTVETQLARMGISREIRAQVLSHGISGVQATHYDRHSYTEEKRAALIAWERHLEGGLTGTNVVELRKTAC